MKNKILIPLGYYFPVTVMFLGMIILLAGLFLLLQYNLIGILLILVSLIIFTARYRLEINLTNQSYHDYLWIAGIKKGEKRKFGSIESLFINKNKYRQTVNSRVSSITKYGTEYNGYIKFDTDKVHLLSSDSKVRVLHKLESIRKKLKGNIILTTKLIIYPTVIDYTEGEPTAIE